LPRAEKYFKKSCHISKEFLFLICVYKLKIVKVLRIAGEATNYLQLEQTIPFAQLHETIKQLVEDHDRALERAQDRKSARSWTVLEETELRRKWEGGMCIAELGEHFDRSQRGVEHHLIVLGSLVRGAIRRSGPGKVQPHIVDNDGEQKGEKAA
jgi:hypothetical protein